MVRKPGEHVAYVGEDKGQDVEMYRFRRNDGALLNVGVVGLGYWGPNLLRGLIELPDVDVCYICDLERRASAALSPGAIPGATPTRSL